MLRLIHLSDIHFGGYGPEWDEDADQREQLLVDVAERVADDNNPADGILIGGDIAFSGKAAEYERAGEWISRLIEASGCPESAIWAVPGNHDVDWDIVNKSHILSGFRRDVRACDLANLDELLRMRLAQDGAASGLIQPFKAYNEFVFGWGCTSSASPSHWKDDVLRIGQTPVLLWGMNSALVSDAGDTGGKEQQPNLVLGTHQAKVRALPAEIRITLCHHPPLWLRDWEHVAPYLARADIALFGHEHTYDAYQPENGGTVHIHAGAVGPEREAGLVPTYNILTLRVDGNELTVIVQPRLWSTEDTRFIPHSEERQDFVVALDRRTLIAMDESPKHEQEESGKSDEEPASATPLTPELAPTGPSGEAPADKAVNDPSRLRALAVSFLSAPVTRRLEIARNLGVLSDEDLDLPDEREQYTAVLTRIRDRGLIEELAEELGI